jgi:outer membrane protein assembly factor BamB
LNALAPSRHQQATAAKPKKRQLEKGPAYGALPVPETTSSDDWPTYRQDGARTGKALTPLGTDLEQAWETALDGELTSLVVAEGKVFLAEIQTHTVYAIDADTGAVAWQRTVGGRVDSPPTIHSGACLFGSRDGHVYCLRASDGELAWRFRAGPEDRRIVAYNELESVWPVHGSILIHDGSAYFAAGRTSYTDDEMLLSRLDPHTGEVLARKEVSSLDPETGREPQKPVRGVSMPGTLPDVLSTDGTNIFMRHQRFDTDLNEQRPDVAHLFCPAGFLDGSWWHRTYWMYGSRMQSGWGGWGKAGYEAPAGRIMVVGENDVYAFGRLNQYGTAGTHVGLAAHLHPWGDEPKETPHYVLFASGKVPNITKLEQAVRRGFDKRLEPKWAQSFDLWVRAMVLAGDTLYLAGAPEPTPDAVTDSDPFGADNTGALRIVSTADGTPLAEYPLSAPPAWDAMAAANGSLYVATTDGKVSCMQGT